MGDKKTLKRAGTAVVTGGLSEAGGLREAASQAGAKKLDPGRGPREAARQANRARISQETSIAKQRQIETLKIAEEESEVAKRKALARPGKGGRSLLVATSPAGITSTLGGV